MANKKKSAPKRKSTPRKKKKVSKAASFRIRDQGVVQILQDSRLKRKRQAFARRIHRVEFGKGRKPTMSQAGSAKIAQALKKVRSKSRVGEAFNETLTVKIRYRGQSGKIKERFENITSSNPADLDQFILGLATGILYENKAGESIAFKTGQGSIVGAKYEKISKVSVERQAKPLRTKYPKRKAAHPRLSSRKKASRSPRNI